MKLPLPKPNWIPKPTSKTFTTFSTEIPNYPTTPEIPQPDTSPTKIPEPSPIERDEPDTSQPPTPSAEELGREPVMTPPRGKGMDPEDGGVRIGLEETSVGDAEAHVRPERDEKEWKYGEEETVEVGWVE